MEKFKKVTVELVVLSSELFDVKWANLGKKTYTTFHLNINNVKGEILRNAILMTYEKDIFECASKIKENCQRIREIFKEANKENVDISNEIESINSSKKALSKHLNEREYDDINYLHNVFFEATVSDDKIGNNDIINKINEIEKTYNNILDEIKEKIVKKKKGEHITKSVLKNLHKILQISNADIVIFLTDKKINENYGGSLNDAQNTFYLSVREILEYITKENISIENFVAIAIYRDVLRFKYGDRIAHAEVKGCIFDTNPGDLLHTIHFSTSTPRTCDDCKKNN